MRRKMERKRRKECGESEEERCREVREEEILRSYDRKHITIVERKERKEGEEEERIWKEWKRKGCGERA